MTETTKSPADTDHLEQYTRLAASSPIYASRYYLAHSAAIDAARTAGSTLAPAPEATDAALPALLAPQAAPATPALPPRTDDELQTLDEIELQHRRLLGCNPIAAARYATSHSYHLNEIWDRQTLGRVPLMPELPRPTFGGEVRALFTPRNGAR